jgi:hypothetical protein
MPCKAMFWLVNIQCCIWWGISISYTVLKAWLIVSLWMMWMWASSTHEAESGPLSQFQLAWSASLDVPGLALQNPVT